MRVYAFAAGLIGFAAIASGGQTVEFSSAPLQLQGEYVYAQGTTQEATIHFAVDRTLKFRFPGADLSANGINLKPEAEDLVTEYDYDDVSAALKEAAREAERATKNKKDQLRKYDQLVPKYLAEMDKSNVHQIDCRVVARQMVEGLVNSTAEALVDRNGRSVHVLVARADDTDVALAGRQLDTATFIRDSSIVPGDIEPRFICRKTWVPSITDKCKNESLCGDNASCGNLVVRYNPQPQTAGVFKGKKAYVINQNACRKQEEQGISYDSCRLNLRIDACGMRYTLKADKGARVANANERGLADELRAQVDGQERDLRHGLDLSFNEAAQAVGSELSTPVQRANTVDEAVVPQTPTGRSAY